MSARYTLGIDYGGTSSKVTLLREDGTVEAAVSRDYPTASPHPGWAEQNPADWLDTLRENLHALWVTWQGDPGDIAAVCVDAATHMAVLLDEKRQVLRPVIHWSDSRSSKEAAWVKEHHGELLAAKSVNAPSSAWTLPQLLWLWEHERETMERVRYVTFAKDYIRGYLTGDFVTDEIEAMGAMLADDRTGVWDAELCAIAGLRPDMLPEIVPCTKIVGTVTEGAAGVTGLKAGTPVIAGATDTVLEVLATGADHIGIATVKLATAGRICPITDAPVPSRQFFNYRHVVPGLWYPGTGTRSCATSYRWFRDTLGGDMSYNELNLLAEKVPVGSENLFFHPYLLGEMTPYYDDALRGGFVGAGMGHTKGHFVRAVLEGVAYSLRDCMEEITGRGIRVDELRLIGGGAKSPLWAQIVADVLQTPLTVPEGGGSSLGAAMLAAMAVGIFPDAAACTAACVPGGRQVLPNAANREVYDRGFGAYRDIQQALAPIYHRLNG